MKKGKNNLEISLIISQLFNEYDYIFKDKVELQNIIYNNLSNEQNFEKIDNDLLDILLSSDEDLYELVDRLLGSSNKSIDFTDVLRKEDFEVFKLNYRNKKNEVEEKETKDNEIVEEVVSPITQDISGSVTVFMLLGSLFISLGVIFTVIMLLGGN